MLRKSLILIVLGGALAAPVLATPPMPPGPGRSDLNANPVSGQVGNQGNQRLVGNAGGERPVRAPAPAGLAPRPAPVGIAPRPAPAPRMAQAPRQEHRQMRQAPREMHRAPAAPRGPVSSPRSGPGHRR